MKKNLLILIILLFLAIIIFIRLNFVNFVIEFEKLRPIKERINIYYNGYKIGKVGNISPCADSINSCVGVRVESRAMYLPDNLTAVLKQKKLNNHKFEDYIELIYPVNPSHNQITKNSKIKGEISSGFHNYLMEEVNYSDMEQIKLALISTTINLDKTISLLAELLASLNETINDSRGEIKSALKNLRESSCEINNASKKINNSINQTQIEKIFQNANDASKNFNLTSENIKEFANKLNNSDTIESLDSITKNANEIIQGVNSKLKKPFSGIRLIFGKVIDNP